MSKKFEPVKFLTSQSRLRNSVSRTNEIIIKLTVLIGLLVFLTTSMAVRRQTSPSVSPVVVFLQCALTFPSRHPLLERSLDTLGGVYSADMPAFVALTFSFT